MAGMTSPTGRCHTFDAKADGYVRAEAVVSTTLHSESAAFGRETGTALRLLGSRVVCDGKSASLTAPNGQAQQALLRAALGASGLTDGLDLLEAYGTGTPLGDPIEMRALFESVYANRSADARPLPVGAVKASVGHTEVAAGAVGLLKLASCLQWREAAPIAGLRTVNPMIASAMPAGCELPLSPSKLAQGPVAGGVSSFGYSGTIAHAVLQAEDNVLDVAAGRDAPLVRSGKQLDFNRRKFEWKVPTKRAAPAAVVDATPPPAPAATTAAATAAAASATTAATPPREMVTAASPAAPAASGFATLSFEQQLAAMVGLARQLVNSTVGPDASLVDAGMDSISVRELFVQLQALVGHEPQLDLEQMLGENHGITTRELASELRKLMCAAPADADGQRPPEDAGATAAAAVSEMAAETAALVAARTSRRSSVEVMIKEEFFKPEQFKEVAAFLATQERMLSAGLRNPFFAVHDGIARNKTSISGKPVLHFSG
eukprot:6320867-Prymnesium_polylepis.1